MTIVDPPHVKELIQIVDEFFKEEYPDYREGVADSHPILPPKESKIIHDSVWGTNRFEWYELALIDSPVIQRLRDIRQVGSASLVYPSATHNRMEHCLGTAIVATKVFDSIRQREYENLYQIADKLERPEKREDFLAQLRQEIRLASLLHDTGHTMFSHTSESAHNLIETLKTAASELSELVGKHRSTGEALSYAIARSTFVKNMIDRFASKIPQERKSLYSPFKADLENVALMIIGRTKHPFTQFMADILTSGFDADKLDYLLRDGLSAGLPVKYDLDRYLEFVCLRRTSYEIPSDSIDFLKEVYGEKKEAGDQWEEYRLGLPEYAITSMEQIIIGKFMLFGYIYHHSKVRAADSYIERTFKETIKNFKDRGISDRDLIKWLLKLTDSVFLSLPKQGKLYESDRFYDKGLVECAYNIMNRTLPRSVIGINGSQVSHADVFNIANFLSNLKDEDKKIMENIEEVLSKEINDPNIAFWMDVPKQPSFEDVKNMVGNVPLFKIFPIHRWSEAYMAYTYKVRIFTFSSSTETLKNAILNVLPSTLNVRREVVERMLKDRNT